MYSSELREQIERDMKLVMTIKNAMVDATDYFNQLKRLGEKTILEVILISKFA